MSHPWPSFGGFQFKREETPAFGTDTGWIKTPNFGRQRPLGHNQDVVTTLSIGSAERSFSVHLTPARLSALELFLGSVATFTDWHKPLPDSRNAYLAGAERAEVGYSGRSAGPIAEKYLVKVTLISAS